MVTTHVSSLKNHQHNFVSYRCTLMILISLATNPIKTEFEMKDLGQTKFCLGLQLEHFHSGIFIYQAAHVQKVLEKFNMDKSYPTKTPMTVRSLDVENDPFRPRKENEEILDHMSHILVPLEH